MKYFYTFVSLLIAIIVYFRLINSIQNKIFHTVEKNYVKKCFIICPNPSIDVLAYIDEISARESNRIKEEKRFPGGKGIHVALALAELEVPTTLVGFWGSENGSWLKKKCKELQPNLSILDLEVEGVNRTCYTFQSNDEWKDTELLGVGPEINEEDYHKLVGIIKEERKSIGSIAVCGSWPEGAKSTYNKEIVELGQELNVPVFLDCTGEQLKNALDSQPFCVHLNRSETENYFNTDFENARNLLIDYCEVAAITDGAKGLYLQNKNHLLHSNVKIENVKSTVGSGDCLMAGILAGYHNRMTFDNISKLGAACGAANCLNEDLGMLLKEDVNNLFPKVLCNSIEQ